MKIICKNNGKTLNKFGYDKKSIDKIYELSEENIAKIKEIIRWRNTEIYDFEYGIGGFIGDEYYKIKNIKLSNNNTEIIVKVSKI